MNEILKQLEASGLVERQQSRSNARILNAHLTRAGKRSGDRSTTAFRNWKSVSSEVSARTTSVS